jgi:hypothetical protein
MFTQTAESLQACVIIQFCLEISRQNIKAVSVPHFSKIYFSTIFTLSLMQHTYIA